MDDIHENPTGGGRPKVALVTNMLPPYRIALYEELAKRVDLTVVVDTLSEFNRKWEVDPAKLGFELKVANSKSFLYRRHRRDVHYTEQRQFHFSEKTFPALRDVRPDAIVTAEFGLRTLWSILYGWLFSKPVILASEGTLHTEGHVGAVKRVLRRFIVARLTRAWSNGPASSALLEAYGLDRGRIDEGMTGIDTQDFRDAVIAARPEREALRAELGLRGRVMLFSGAFTARKGLTEFLAAADRVAAQPGCPEFSLLLLGDGALMPEVRQWKEQHPDIAVALPGFVQHGELPRYFAAADWAVLPTLDDNWPLATLETLVAGLPQLFSIYNGATEDLCQPETGLRHDPLCPDGFAEALGEALRSPLDRVPEATVDHFARYYSADSQAVRGADSVARAIAEAP